MPYNIGCGNEAVKRLKPMDNGQLSFSITNGATIPAVLLNKKSIYVEVMAVSTGSL